MHVGVFHFPTEYAIDIRELATALESRGYEALFVCEHTHIPSSRRSPFPGGGELPRRYSHTHDPFIALAFAAGVTSRLTLATGIALMSQRDPIVTAKTVASLDQFSGGRVIVGVGAGWNAEEMENHGTRFEDRFEVMRERVLAMKALWTQEEASFKGQFVNIAPSWMNPKPLRKPHPPIILGGETDHTLQRVVEFCDGWFPRVRGEWNAREAMTRLRQAAEKAGRDPKSLSVTVFGAPMDAATLDEYRALGIDRVLFHAPDRGRDDVLRLLDQNMVHIKP